MAKFKRKLSSARECSRNSEKTAYRYIRRAKRGYYRHNGARSDIVILQNLVYFGIKYKIAQKAMFNESI